MSNKKDLINYLEYEGSYCYYLELNRKKLYALALNDNITLSYYKRVIFNIIKNANITEKKLEFIKNVENMTDKLDISKYVFNSIKKAKETIVDKDKVSVVKIKK